MSDLLPFGPDGSLGHTRKDTMSPKSVRAMAAPASFTVREGAWAPQRKMFDEATLRRAAGRLGPDAGYVLCWGGDGHGVRVALLDAQQRSILRIFALPAPLAAGAPA